MVMDTVMDMVITAMGTGTAITDTATGTVMGIGTDTDTDIGMVTAAGGVVTGMPMASALAGGGHPAATCGFATVADGRN